MSYKIPKPLLPLLLSILFLTGRGEGPADSYSFLGISSSTHAYALGGSGAAVIGEDVTLVDQNPALIGPELGMQGALSYMRYLASSNFAAARFGMGAGEHSAWAAGIRYLDYGRFDGYDSNGVSTGNFSPKDMVFEASYSRDINSRFRGGVNFKMIYSAYDSFSAFALAADLGVNYYYEVYDLSLSLVLRNMGGQLKKFDSQATKLPFEVELAYMQGLGSSPFSLAITATDLTHWRLPYYNHDDQNPEEQQSVKQSFGKDLFRHLIFGLQYNPSDNLYFALGYNYRTRTDMSNYHRTFLSGWSIGMGLKVRSFGVGLAYAQPHAAGSTLMLNLSLGTDTFR